MEGRWARIRTIPQDDSPCGQDGAASNGVGPQWSPGRQAGVVPGQRVQRQLSDRYARLVRSCIGNRGDGICCHGCLMIVGHLYAVEFSQHRVRPRFCAPIVICCDTNVVNFLLATVADRRQLNNLQEVLASQQETVKLLLSDASNGHSNQTRHASKWGGLQRLRQRLLQLQTLSKHRFKLTIL